MGEASGTEKVPDTHLQTPAEPGDANLLSASCPPSLEGQMLAWSQPDLWSEDKKKGGGEESGWGAAGSLVNTR